MGKASKRERQKTNKAIREEELARKAARKKIIRSIQALILVLIIPIVVIISVLVGNATKDDVYTAKITVSIEGEDSLPNKGILELVLDNKDAPKSVKHFNSFASNKEYDGLTWHRVVTDFVIQGGDPNGDGTGSLGESIVAELPSDGYKPGDLAWAKSSNEEAGTASSQFFIVTGDKNAEGLKALNQKAVQNDGSEKYQYGYIGKVTKGLDLARKIEALASKEDATGEGIPTKKATIIKIEVFKNGKKIKPGDLIAPTTSSTTTPITVSSNP